jgi:hypothetical protein
LRAVVFFRPVALRPADFFPPPDAGAVVGGTGGGVAGSGAGHEEGASS